jgi:hypothetical protein
MIKAQNSEMSAYDWICSLPNFECMVEALKTLGHQLETGVPTCIYPPGASCTVERAANVAAPTEISFCVH